MSDFEVRAFVTRILCKHDSVLGAALNSIEGMPKNRAYMTLALICRAFQGDMNVRQDDLMRMHQE